MEQYFHFCNQSIALILSDPGPIIVLPCLLLAHSLVGFEDEVCLKWTATADQHWSDSRCWRHQLYWTSQCYISLFFGWATNCQLFNAWIWFGWSVSRAAICNRFQKLSFFGIVWRYCVVMIKLTFEQKLNSKKNTQFLRPFLHYKIYDSHRFGKYMTTRRTETNIPPGTGCVQQQEMLYHWKTTLPRYWEQSLLFHRNFLLCGKRYCAVAGPEVLHSLVATFQISSSSSLLSSSSTLLLSP